MTAFEPVTIADYWHDTGEVGVSESHSGSKSYSKTVSVKAIDCAFDGGPLEFTPGQARTFAAAIVAAANHIDPEGARPLAVRDNDGDVWTRTGADEYTYDGLRHTLAEIRDDYGPLKELTP